ncbi:hypothetical protein QF032_003782 [Streptomyces achromogenes]|uniref:hypothetical protein n=1 Tax=Streptomyces achromogenes TaxID=67255 RepID=UPI00277E1533|nr:hypothetical protein [Streptomyces achromogenes]MDQ0831938.1 hypothetical protein [Streptomyces achromogenes]
MSTPAGGGVVGSATIIVTADTTAAALAIRGLTRDADGRLRDLRGRFVSESRAINNSLNSVTTSSDKVSEAISGIQSAALLLAPALIPIAVQAAPIAASMGAAAVAVGVFGAAAAGQATAITEAADAEKKYQDAVDEHGATSKQAAEAQTAYVKQIQKMPPATRTAAAALSSLKDQYQNWSDALAGDTMPVATKAFQTFSAVFPKLTPLVQGTSTQLDRFVTIAAGSINTPGFDALIDRFTTFATGALAKANDGLVHFLRTADTGKVSGAVSEFMDYVRANGPLVKETLANVVQALANIAQAAANAGPGLLTLVNAFAGLVASVPPGVITTMLQLALALKAVRIAAAGAEAISLGLTAFATGIGAMRTAAAGASGVLPRLGAAMGALSRSAKVAVAGTGIGLLVIALSELAQRGREAPPDVDALTSSLRQLAATGKATGEAAKVFGSDLDGLYGKVRSLTDPTTTDKVQQFLVGWTGWDSTPVKEATENLDAIDQTLAGLVKSGQADVAAAAVKRLTAEYGEGGKNTAEFTSKLEAYKSAVSDATFEQQHGAAAMGIFGAQAQLTSAKLDVQKASAEGLRLAIQALNDVNRGAYDAQIGFESSLDALTASFKEHGATLNIDSAAGRANGQAMSAAAKAQDELLASGVAAGGSLESMTQKSNTLRATMLKLATDAFDGNKKKAQEYVNTLLGTPDKITTLVKAERADAISGLKQVQAEINKTPGAKKVTVSTLSAAAIKALENVGLKVRQLPDGKVEVSAGGNALGNIYSVGQALNNIDGKTANTYVVTHYKRDDGASFLGPSGRYATGGLVGFPSGGRVRGAGTGTSDSILARVSNGEYVIPARRVQEYGPAMFDAIRAGTLSTARPAAAAPSWSSLGVGSMRTAAAAGPTNISLTVKVTNSGVLGSQREVENWLTMSLDRLKRQGRLNGLMR